MMEEMGREAQLTLLKLYTAKANSGDITAAEAAVLRNLLRDIGLIFTPRPAGAPEATDEELPLPDLDDPHYG